jgi:nucleoside-diphosphate-sugar epimerase
MSVMVTGIGFVGGYVVRDLLIRGEDVVAYGLFGGKDRESDPSSLPDLLYLNELLADVEAPGKLTVVSGDIFDAEHMSDTIQGHGVTSAVHLASLISASSQADIPRAVDVNIRGTVNLFEASVNHHLERVVWASTINVFGPRSISQDGTISDASPLDPSTVYGSCKAMLETVARSYFQHKHLNVVGLRLSRVYGYGQHMKAGRGPGSNWLGSLLQAPAEGAGPLIVPFAERSIDLQYVEDVSESILSVLRQRSGGGETYLTNGDYRSVADAFHFVRRLFPEVDMELVEGADAANLTPGSQTNWEYRFDSSRAARELGIVRRTSMEEGFRKTLEAYRKAAGLPPIQPEKVDR